MEILRTGDMKMKSITQLIILLVGAIFLYGGFFGMLLFFNSLFFGIIMMMGLGLIIISAIILLKFPSDESIAWANSHKHLYDVSISNNDWEIKWEYFGIKNFKQR